MIWDSECGVSVSVVMLMCVWCVCVGGGDSPVGDMGQ